MKTLKIFLLLFGITTLTFAQNHKELSTPTYVWFGLDYSNVKCIGEEGFNDPANIVASFFDAWNDLMLNEEKKYDFTKAYYKSKRINDLELVTKRNDIPTASELVINHDYKFEPGTLENIVKAYKSDEYKDAVGLLYVVEYLNKTERQASIHVVFFDIPTGKILYTNNYIEYAGGFGFRNYWARPIYDTIKDSSRDFKKTLKKMK